MIEYDRPDRDLKFILKYNSEQVDNINRVSFYMTDKDDNILGPQLREIDPKELYVMARILSSLTETFYKQIEENESDFWTSFDKELDVLGRQLKSPVKIEAPKGPDYIPYKKLFL